MEISARHKVYILVFAVIVAGIYFFSYLFVGLLFIIAVVGGVAYMFYKGIQNQLAAIGRSEFGKNQAAAKLFSLNCVSPKCDK